MESDYSDDDDYLPITAGAWGDQARQQPEQDDIEDAENTHHDPTKTDIDGWSGLIDPEAKKLAGALGSGGLHRQGKNYKPISEEHIIKQRKGVVIPKSSKDTKKSRAPRFTNKQTSPTPSTSSHRNFSRPTNAKRSTFSKPKQSAPVAQPPPPSTIRRPPPPSSSGQTGWGAQPLVETPFWEKKNNPATPLQQQNEASNQWGSWGREDANGTTKKPSTSGFNNSHSPPATTTPTRSVPPGFGPVPQRQYPVKSNKMSQPPPPPGFSYSEKPACGTPTDSSSNNNNSQLHSWATNDEDKELWKKMEEGTRATNQPTNNDNTSNGANNNNNKNLDWVSGWDDLSFNKKSTPPPPQPPPSQDTSNSWSASPTTTNTGGWGASPTTTNTGGWGTSSNTGGWGSTPSNTNTGGWGSAPGTTTTQTGGWGVSPSSNSNGSHQRGSTAAEMTLLNQDDDTTPMQFLDQQMAGYNKGRFSDPSKNKYSSTTLDQDTGSKHLPKNYYTRNGTSRPAFMDAPHKVAQPPPSHNPVVISIHLELDNGSKVPIPIRKLDSPETLARTFCQSQNITNPALIHGITDLFAQQKSSAMKRYNRS